ncbi:MAG: hypothetical protein OXN83_03235, partial [Oligoflexia bacterium]|nr:hypothetical protein [Oligoflexia bacterium]
LLSFFVIAISGYQCSTRVVTGQRDTIPIAPITESSQPGTDDYYYSENYLDNEGENNNNNLPQEVTDRCSRKQLRDLNYGAIANFEFDKSSLQDFVFGQSQNFETLCARFYLDMSRLSYNNTRVYKGSLGLALMTNDAIKTFSGFNSGYSASENRYNRWGGYTWEAGNTGKINKNFHAIFVDEHSALIVKLTDVSVRDIGDGEVGYIG